MKNARIVPFGRRRRGEGDVWQAALVRMPAWVEEGRPEPFRPVAGVAVSTTAGLIAPSRLVPPEEQSPTLVEDAIEALRIIAGEKPAVVEVADQTLAGFLRARLESQGIRVELREGLPAVAAATAELARVMTKDGETRFPAVASVPGITLDHVRAFADAAVAFDRAAPWLLLDDTDPIRFESPCPDPNVRYGIVMGAAGEEFGVMFFPDIATLEMFKDGEDPTRDGAIWSVSYWEPERLPFAEDDLWEDNGLPRLAGRMIPAAVCLGPKRRVRRASLRMLSFFEAVLRALAASEERELDQGRWTKRVQTCQGPVELAMILVEADEATLHEGFPSRLATERSFAKIERLLEGHDFADKDELNAFLERERAREDDAPTRPLTPVEHAQELAWQALDGGGRRRVRFARQALELWPDCADAFTALARAARSAEAAAALYAEAVAAGERALGPEAFTEGVGHFWGMHRTRPYMRARCELAQCLWEMSRREEAIGHYRGLLRLNPNDNQGVRFLLAPALLVMRDYRGCLELLRTYKGDAALAAWQYNRALASFCTEGDTAKARRHLRSALEANPFAAEFLLDPERVEDESPPRYSIGSEEEAIVYVDEALEAWHEAPGALDWLRDRRLGVRRPPATAARKRARTHANEDTTSSSRRDAGKGTRPR